MRTRHNNIIILAICLLFIFCFASCATKASSDSKLIITEVNQKDFDSSRDSDLVPWKENPVKTAQKTKTLRFYFLTGFDSGEKTRGDCCLAVFPNGETMLIDSGVSSFGNKIAQNLLALGIDHLDYLLFTHAHDDHCYGALNSQFLQKITVGTCYYNGIHNSEWGNENLVEDTMKYRNIDLKILGRGDTLDIGGVHIDVLAPTSENVGKTLTTGETNETSIVMKFTYGDTTALFTGDINSTNENELLSTYSAEFLDVDFLKLAHHCIGTSNSEAFLKVTTPICAMAEGRGSIPDYLYTDLGKLGCKSYMDNVDGYVRVILDGEHLTVSPGKERKTKYYDRMDTMFELLRQKQSTDSTV